MLKARVLDFQFFLSQCAWGSLAMMFKFLPSLLPPPHPIRLQLSGADTAARGGAGCGGFARRAICQVRACTGRQGRAGLGSLQPSRTAYKDCMASDTQIRAADAPFWTLSPTLSFCVCSHLQPLLFCYILYTGWPAQLRTSSA